MHGQGTPNCALLPKLQITCDMDKGIMFFLLQMAALKFHLKKESTTNQNWKGKDYTFKEFISDCVQKMTEPAQREGGNDSTVDE